MVNIYISVDMEGIAGIATLDQVARGGHGYPLAQRLMTAEANAAIAGAFDGGATSVTVNDSHGTMDNLLPDQLDPRARLVIGSPKMLCMAEGAEPTHDLALFVGYHAPAGGPGVLAHTFSAHFGEVRLNGAAVSEADVNALHLASLGVPLGVLTGDDIMCELAATAFPGTITVPVKNAHGWSSASSLSPTVAAERIRTAAAEAVSRAATFSTVEVPEALTVEVDLPDQTAAELAAMIPGMSRSGDRTVRRVLADPQELIGLLAVLYTIAASAVAGRQAIVTRR